MSRMGDEIRRSMGRREGKDILVAYAKALEGQEAPRLATLETKFSKLLNGNPEGERYFLGTPRRCAGLERALGVESGWLDGLRRVRVLILDPALPDPVKTYLRERESAGAGLFACRDVSLEGLPPAPPREAVLKCIRQVAERERDGLVVGSADDRLYFAGADLAWTTVKQVARGFLLDSDPDLVPLPEPQPPPRFDSTGEPMIPNEEYERAVREELTRHGERSGRYPGHTYFSPCHEAGGCLLESHDNYGVMDRLIRDADTHERPASFPVARIFSWLVGRACGESSGERGPGSVFYFRRRSAPISWHEDSPEERTFAHALFNALAEASTSTLVWSRGKKIFGAGPHVSFVRELLAPYHEVAELESIARWKEAVAQWNPWRSGRENRGGNRPSDRWRRLRDEVDREAGISIDETVDAWRIQVEQRRFSMQAGPARLARTEEAVRAQAALAELAYRSWGEGSRRPLQLDAASVARLAVLPGDGEEGTVHVIANLGAGRLLRILAVRFPGEEPHHLDLVEEQRDSPLAVFDGGDVRLRLASSYDELLEGSALPARARRRAEDDD